MCSIQSPQHPQVGLLWTVRATGPPGACTEPELPAMPGRGVRDSSMAAARPATDHPGRVLQGIREGTIRMRKLLDSTWRTDMITVLPRSAIAMPDMPLP